jgi:hypothetical protein
MAFSIESTFDGRAIIVEDCISSGTLTPGQLVQLTKGAGKPTATTCTVTAAPDAVVVKGGTTGLACTMARIFAGDVLVVNTLAANGSTALSTAEIASHTALVGSQAQRIATGALALNGVTEAGGKLELLSFDTQTLKSRVRVKA